MSRKLTKPKKKEQLYIAVVVNVLNLQDRKDLIFPLAGTGHRSFVGTTKDSVAKEALHYAKMWTTERYQYTVLVGELKQSANTRVRYSEIVLK